MHIIQPCCAARHLRELRDLLGESGTKQFEGYDDMSLTELLPALLGRYSETRMLIAVPYIPDQAAEAIAWTMRKQLARMDGKGKMDVVSHLTLLADLSEDKSPAASAWEKQNPFAGRMEIRHCQQSETVILLPDLAIIGPVNLRYGRHFTATITADKSQIEELWASFRKPEVTEVPRKRQQRRLSPLTTRQNTRKLKAKK